MGCSQQYVSLILKGKENLTLETISKMEKVLGTELIVHPGDCVQNYGSTTGPRPQYLNDSGKDAMESGIQTGSIVDGYKPGKKKGIKKE